MSIVNYFGQLTTETTNFLFSFGSFVANIAKFEQFLEETMVSKGTEDSGVLGLRMDEHHSPCNISPS
jgi:hypothetical protein